MLFAGFRLQQVKTLKNKECSNFKELEIIKQKFCGKSIDTTAPDKNIIWMIFFFLSSGISVRLCMLGKITADNLFEIFSFFPPQNKV